MTTPTPQGEEKPLVMSLGDEECRVRLDDDGYLERVQRIVCLDYGVHLYAAAKNPRDDDKVAPYQPGYMKLVNAMGGTLTCPPAMRDPETGRAVANPRIETYKGTGTIRFVTATAVCMVPNPVTGQMVASIGTITVDAEHILREVLLGIGRDDCVQILSQEEIDELKADGTWRKEYRGWSVLPLTPPYAMICANMGKEGVRTAFKNFLNQSKTIRQLASSKAERLAADHNPITRMVMLYGDLNIRRNADGHEVGRFTRVPCVAWVRRDTDYLRNTAEALALRGEADGVGQLLITEADASEELANLATNPDAALEQDAASLLAETGAAEGETNERDVQAVTPPLSFEEQLLNDLLRDADDLERTTTLGVAELNEVRGTVAGGRAPTAMGIEQLEAYVEALKEHQPTGEE